MATIIILNAVICAVSFIVGFLWIFAIPGVDGDYATGWEISFIAIVVYFCTSFLCLIVGIIGCFLNPSRQSTISVVTKKSMLAAFVIFILVEIYAFAIMF